MKSTLISESKLQELLGEGQLDLCGSYEIGPYSREVYLYDECYDQTLKFLVVEFQPSKSISGYWT